jgi:hypothetical protein
MDLERALNQQHYREITGAAARMSVRSRRPRAFDQRFWTQNPARSALFLYALKDQFSCARTCSLPRACTRPSGKHSTRHRLRHRLRLQDTAHAHTICSVTTFKPSSRGKSMNPW